MKQDKDKRWMQRYNNFTDTLTFLQKSTKKENPSELERAGIVQSFEFTFELAWKTIKDFLNEKGSDARYPREVLKEAFQNELITDGETWMNMLDSRNIMSHTYRTKDAEYVYQQIVSGYLEAFRQLQKNLEKEQ